MSKSKDDSAAHEPASQIVPEFDVGLRLQAVRKSRGLSQRELARRAGMTNSNLSLVEQGKISPSVSTLEKIVVAIPMSLAEFFSGGEEVISPVVAREDFIQFTRQGVRLEILQLAYARSQTERSTSDGAGSDHSGFKPSEAKTSKTSPLKNAYDNYGEFYFARQWLPPGTISSSEWIEKNCFIAGIVEQGALSLYLDGRDFTVEWGEGFHFSALRPHRLTNPFEDECVASIVALPL